MRATYQFQNSPKLNSNWSESIEKDLLLPVHDSNPVVGVVGTENIVLAVEKTVTDPRSATNTLPLDNTGIILTCGYAPFLVEMVQIEIEDSDRFHEYSFPISPEYVACKVAGVDLQLDCCDRKLDSLLTLIVGFKPFTELWVAHPSGMVRKCGAHAIGRDFELRNEFLLKNYNFEETSGKKAVKLAIRALLEVGESGEKNIEVTLITREHGLKRLKQAGIDTIIAEIEAEKIEGEKAASEKEQKKEKTAAARKKKRKAMKVVKKTPPGEPLDADLAEMDAKHVEIAPLEGPEVDEIKAENATHTWISKYFFRKYPTREEKRAANAAKAAKKRAEERAEEHRKTLEKLLVSFAAKSDDEIGYYCPYVAVPHVTTPLRCESKDDFVDSCMTGIQ